MENNKILLKLTLFSLTEENSRCLMEQRNIEFILVMYITSLSILFLPASFLTY